MTRAEKINLIRSRPQLSVATLTADIAYFGRRCWLCFNDRIHSSAHEPVFFIHGVSRFFARFFNFFLLFLIETDKSCDPASTWKPRKASSSDFTFLLRTHLFHSFLT